MKIGNVHSKQKIHYNFIDSNILRQIWERSAIFSEHVDRLIGEKDTSLEQLASLQKENKVLLTAVMFIAEDFDLRSNSLEIGRLVRLNYIFASICLVRSKLEKSQKNIRYLAILLENSERKEKGSGLFQVLVNHYSKYRIVAIQKSIRGLVFFANLSLKQIGREYEVRKMFHKSLTSYEMSSKDIRVGDVVLSYKTKKYLESAFLSRMISIAQKSNITHSSIVSFVGAGHIEHIDPTPDNDHIIMPQVLNNKENEVLFIMRPKLPIESYIKLRQELDTLRSEINESKVVYRFAEYKQWFAALQGLLYSNFIYFFRKIVLFGNIFKENDAFYCSEFIDHIFKRIGVYLVPRSEHDSMVWPAELLYSPFLELVWVIYNKSEIEYIQSEEIVL